MFPIELNHLHILFMLVLAFFTYRKYGNDTLAIQSQPYEASVFNNEKQDDQHVVEEGVDQQKVSSQNVPDTQGNVPSLMVAEDQDVQDMKGQEVKIYSYLKTLKEELILSTFDVVAPVAIQGLQKYEFQDSTLFDRNQGAQLEEICEQQNQEQCSSSSSRDKSSSDSSVSQESNENAESKAEKKKQIKKYKKKQKKNLRRHKLIIRNLKAELLEIQ